MQNENFHPGVFIFIKHKHDHTGSQAALCNRIRFFISKLQNCICNSILAYYACTCIWDVSVHMANQNDLVHLQKCALQKILYPTMQCAWPDFPFQMWWTTLVSCKILTKQNSIRFPNKTISAWLEIIENLLLSNVLKITYHIIVVMQKLVQLIMFLCTFS